MMAETRSRHGQRTLIAAIKVRDLNALDKRCAGYKALAAWRSELIEALGGEDAVTPQKRVLVDAIVRSKLYIDNLDCWLLGQRSLVNGRKRAVLTAVMQRQTLVDGMARLLSQIGLERQQKPVKPLDQYIAEKNAEKEKPA
jgi:hypothetical protein